MNCQGFQLVSFLFLSAIFSAAIVFSDRKKISRGEDREVAALNPKKFSKIMILMIMALGVFLMYPFALVFGEAIAKGGAGFLVVEVGIFVFLFCFAVFVLWIGEKEEKEDDVVKI